MMLKGPNHLIGSWSHYLNSSLDLATLPTRRRQQSKVIAFMKVRETWKKTWTADTASDSGHPLMNAVDFLREMDKVTLMRTDEQIHNDRQTNESKTSGCYKQYTIKIWPMLQTLLDWPTTIAQFRFGIMQSMPLLVIDVLGWKVLAGVSIFLNKTFRWAEWLRAPVKRSTTLYSIFSLYKDDAGMSLDIFVCFLF